MLEKKKPDHKGARGKQSVSVLVPEIRALGSCPAGGAANHPSRLLSIPA
jgi:hypothetical protein